VVDLNYLPGRMTPLLERLPAGVTGHDGVGMLVHQAALAFGLWLGVEGETVAAFRSIRLTAGAGAKRDPERI
jgi:shikimate 5-dehydrogenase